MLKTKNLDWYIGKRCNVKYMNLLTCPSFVADKVSPPYPLEFIILNHQNGIMIISLTGTRDYTWKIPLSRLYNFN